MRVRKWIALAGLVSFVSACSDDSAGSSVDAAVDGVAGDASVLQDVWSERDGGTPADAEPPPDVQSGPYESESMIVYAASPMARIVDNEVPDEDQALEWSAERLLSIFAAPGQYEPATFVIRPRGGPLQAVTVQIGDLQGRGGKRIPASAVQAYLVKCWYALDCNNIFGCGPNAPRRYWPELLVRDDSLLDVDHDTQSNILNFDDLPTVPDTLLPFDIPADHIKQVWLKVHVPRDAEPGYYVAEVTVSAGDESVVLPLVVEVVDIALARNLDDLGVYVSGVTVSEEHVEWMVADLAEHGVNMPYIHSPVLFVDTQEKQQALLERLAIWDRHGLLTRRAVITVTKLEHYFWDANDGETLDAQPELRTQIAEVAAQFHELLNTHYPGVTFYAYGKDEQQGNEEAYRISREHGMPVFVASNAANYEIAYRARFTGMWWIFAEWAYQIHRAHETEDPVMRSGMYVMGSYARDPVLYRLRAGFWLWDQPADGYIPWVWMDAWSREAWTQTTTWYFARPATNGVIDTIQWEGYHAGAVDGQYASTLAMMVEKARDLGIQDPLLDEIDGYLQYIDILDFDSLQNISGQGQNSFVDQFPAEKLDEARARIRDYILELQRRHPELHSRNVAGDEELAERAFRTQLARTPLLTKPYPYGVDEWPSLKDTFFQYYNQADYDGARPYAQQLKDILDAKQREFQTAPKPDWDGQYITPLEWWLLRMEVWDQIQEVLNH